MTKKHPSNTLIRLLLLSNVRACTCTCACSASNWCHRRKSHRLEWLAAEHAKRPDVARTRLLTIDTGATETPERRERERRAFSQQTIVSRVPSVIGTNVERLARGRYHNAGLSFRANRILPTRREGARRGGEISRVSDRVTGYP